jgi:hypothetical protein
MRVPGCPGPGGPAASSGGWLRPLHTIGYTHVGAGLEELVRTRRIYVYEGQAANLHCKKRFAGFPRP